MNGAKYFFSFFMTVCGLLLWTGVQAAPLEGERDAPAPQALTALWQKLAPVVSQFPLSWQRRYLELESIADDLLELEQQITPLLNNLYTALYDVQRHATPLLHELGPARDDPQDTAYLARGLQGWQWYLEAPLKEVTTADQDLTLYARVLKDMDAAFQRATPAAQPNAALERSLDSLRQIHAALLARVEGFLDKTQPLIAPSQQLLDRISQAVENTEKVLPKMWVDYYTVPDHLTKLSWPRVGEDFRNMSTNLLRTTIFPRQVGVLLLIDAMVAGAFGLFFLLLTKTLTQRPGHKTSLLDLLLMSLDALSVWRKCSLAVMGICLTNIVLDALPGMHLHVPYLALQNIALAAAVAPWARSRSQDSRLHMLLVPVIVGLLMLHADATLFWMTLFLGGALALCALSMWLHLRKKNDISYMLWMAGLLLCLVLVLLGFSYLAVPLLFLGLLLKAGITVLNDIARTPMVRAHPLGFILLMPLFTLVLCLLCLTATMLCPGFAVLLADWQSNDLRLFGLHLSLWDAMMLVMLFLGLLALGRVSWHFLLAAANSKSLLDTSAVPVIHTVVNCLLWIIFGLFALGLMGVDVQSLAFIGGALTVGLGLGLQNIVCNFFSGLLILFTKVVRGGDLIEVGAIKGLVRSVNMRSTVVETTNNAILSIPNVEILNTRIINWTKNDNAVCEDIALSLSPESNIQQALTIMKDIAASSSGVMASPAPEAFLTSFEGNALNFTLQIWVEDVTCKSQVISDVLCALHTAFAREGLSLALPQMMDIRLCKK